MVALIVVASSSSSCWSRLARTIRVVPQARAGVVERLGRYQPHAEPGADDR